MWLTLAVCLWSAPPELAPELLGYPVKTPGLSIFALTTDAAGRRWAWGVLGGGEFRGVVGIDVESGAVKPVDLAGYGWNNIQACRATDGNLYLYSGTPGRFFRYDVKADRLDDLGVPVKNATYWTRGELAASGRFFVGTYPGPNLVSVDTATGAIQDHGRMSDDPLQHYVMDTAVVEGAVYVAAGLHHPEVWRLDLATGTKRQLLPAALKERAGSADLWIAADGAVYGRSGAQAFRCLDDRVELVDQAPPARREPLLNVADELTYGPVEADGRLRITPAGGEPRDLATRFQGDPLQIYSVGPIVDGVLYGSGIKLGRFFSVDLATARLTDHGVVTGGRIQVYDGVATPQGIFFGSYTGASIDLLDPRQPIAAGQNPKRVVSLQAQHLQERPNQLVLGPDRMVYVASTPVKGRLGGALTRIDPTTLAVDCWRNVVPEQSLLGLAPLPETGELLLASTVAGGSSAKPTQTEAVLAFWNLAEAKVTATIQPVAGARSYQAVVRGRDGLVYGVAGDRWFVVDPRRRETLHVGELPGKALRFPFLHDTPVGPAGAIVGLVDDLVFAIDPATRAVKVLGRHDSLRVAHGFTVTDEGVLYYGAKTRLMRCQIAW